jgi:hypothetical protein
MKTVTKLVDEGGGAWSLESEGIRYAIAAEDVERMEEATSLVPGEEKPFCVTGEAEDRRKLRATLAYGTSGLYVVRR